MSSVLILNHEPMSERMPGPSLRNWELARALARRFDVTLAAPGQPAVTSTEFKVIGWDVQPSEALIGASDVVKVSGFLLDEHPQIAKARHLVVDLYDPFPLENLHMYEERPLEERYRIAAHDRNVQTGLVRAGDVFLCASERQRDFWLGWLAAAGRVNPYLHHADAGFERFLLVVPFGVSDEPPKARPRRFRGVMAGIGEDDLVVMWGGGIWNWFDPLTLIRAAAQTRDQLPHLRVVFPVTSVPSPDVLPMAMLDQAIRLSDELGLTGSRVFFGSSWIPHDDFGGVLLEADIGVSLHQPSIETRFSFRTRILDYLWAGLPIIATSGDSMADLVRARDLGAVVPAADVGAVVNALVELGSDFPRRQACAARSRTAAAQFRWSEVARPLIEYCAEPFQAPDRTASSHEAATVRTDGGQALPSESGRIVRRAVTVLRAEGPKKLAVKGAAYIKRRRKS